MFGYDNLREDAADQIFSIPVTLEVIRALGSAKAELFFYGSDEEPDTAYFAIPYYMDTLMGDKTPLTKGTTITNVGTRLAPIWSYRDDAPEYVVHAIDLSKLDRTLAIEMVEYLKDCHLFHTFHMNAVPDDVDRGNNPLILRSSSGIYFDHSELYIQDDEFENQTIRHLLNPEKVSKEQLFKHAVDVIGIPPELLDTLYENTLNKLKAI